MQTVTVNRAICPIMKKPDRGSERVDEALYGMMLRVQEQYDSQWLYILTDYDYEGYVQAAHVCFNGYEGDRQTVIIRAADVLAAPDTKANVWQTIPLGGALVRKGEAENRYAEILLADGRTGYIREKALGQNREKAAGYGEFGLRQALAEAAIRYMGTQYRWGGKSPWGIDCSGLCFMAYRLNGITIFRDARIHPDFPIKEIGIESLGMGDLIFFPGHVAMYIDNGLFIHSSVANGGVAYNALDPSNSLYNAELHNSICAAGSIFSSKPF